MIDIYLRRTKGNPDYTEGVLTIDVGGKVFRCATMERPIAHEGVFRRRVFLAMSSGVYRMSLTNEGLQYGLRVATSGIYRRTELTEGVSMKGKPPGTVLLCKKVENGEPVDSAQTYQTFKDYLDYLMDNELAVMKGGCVAALHVYESNLFEWANVSPRRKAEAKAADFNWDLLDNDDEEDGY